MASGMIGGAPKASTEETILQSLARICEERIATLVKQNHRVEGFLDRTSPQPEAVSANKNQPEPPADMTFNGLQYRLTVIGENLDRLSHLCDRLERIA